MKRIALLLVLLVVAGVGPARAQPDVLVYRTTAAEDVSFPFWCDWAYDWEARCYRDFSDRLPVGGEDDKVWRAGLRFPLGAIPPGSIVTSATFLASFDGVCLGPRKTARPCPARSYPLDIHPIFSADWFSEREVEIGPLAAQGSFWARTPQRLSFDVTDLVIEWVEYGAPNHGLLLKLADSEEDYSVSGPRLPSSEFPNAALRPMLEVTYMPP